MKTIMKMMIITAICLSVGNAFAFTMTVNGDLSEWGVNPTTYNSANPNNNANWTPTVSGISKMVEDNNPSINYVGPGYGGQLFDAEAMYITSDSTNLYFAVVTGFYPGVVNGYVAGDIAFDFGKDGSYEYGLATWSRTGIVKGNLYAVSSASDWNKGLWTSIEPQSDPTYMNAGSFKYGDGSSSNFSYDGNDYYSGNRLHYVLEGYVPVSSFNGKWGQDVRVHWTMSCGNDYLFVDYRPAPEPATLALFGVGLAGFLRLRKKKSRP